MNDNIFCTLFDSNYLDKGLALYDSLKKNCDKFRLYVFAFDNLCKKILKDMNLESLIVISLEEFETDQLLKIKKERSSAEYCWTCTPVIIEYVLDRFKEKICTYLDADIYFYNSPDILLNEMKKEKKSIILVRHNFPKTQKGKKEAEEVGKYCVEFNTFKNDENGRKALFWWKEKCLEWCFAKKEINRYGDQKYLDYFEKLFEKVYILKNYGAGVAPWNLHLYKQLQKNNLKFQYSTQDFEVVFYHFAGINYILKDKVNLNLSYEIDQNIIETIYFPYLYKIERIRKYLNSEYNLLFNTQRSIYNNKLKAFLKSKIRVYFIRSRNSCINLKKLNEWAKNNENFIQ